MNRDDYLEIIEIYKHEADVLAEKIERREKLRKCRFKNIKERNENEYSLKLLYDMRNDVLYSMNCLIKKVEDK